MTTNQSYPFTSKVVLSDGTEILMEVNTGPHDGPVSAHELEIKAQQALKAVSGLANDIKEAVMKAKPDKVTAEFSLELEKKDGDIMSKICNISGKGGIKFTFEWNFGNKEKAG